VLLTNDDGVHSRGLAALEQALEGLAEVCIVAPDTEQSAASHAISLHRPLRIQELGTRRWSVDGTPTDCVYVAVHHLLRDERPALVLSGINHGANLADDVTYSGTVAAAMEASLLGIPAAAFSLAVHDRHDFTHAQAFARALATAMLERGLPRGVLLNVNFPRGPVKGFRVTCLGKRSYGSSVLENVDPRGRKYYWIGGSESRHENVPDSDCNAVFDDGLVSVTPLHLDLTERTQQGSLRSWELPGFGRSG
jgi:5'-nucleotidase